MNNYNGTKCILTFLILILFFCRYSYAQYNTFYGYRAGFTTTGNYNSLFGSLANYSGFAGASNTLFGGSAGYSTSGSNNSFFGASSGANHGSSNYGTYIGSLSGRDSNEDYETFIGFESGKFSDAAYSGKNTFLGTQSGYNGDGNSNVFIGYQAGYNETGSNKLYIDNSSTSTPLIYGDFSARLVGINVIPSYQFQVQNAYTDGYTWYNASDKSIKEGFTSISSENILNKIKNLKIERWNYKSDSIDVSHVGPYAQEFNETFKVGKDINAISTLDEIGITLAAVKALNILVQNKIEETNQRRKLVASILEKQIKNRGQNKLPIYNSKSEGISIYIPTDVRDVLFLMYDTDGRLVYNLKTSARGYTSVDIKDKRLNHGKYYYTLIADGITVITEQLIISD